MEQGPIPSVVRRIDNACLASVVANYRGSSDPRQEYDKGETQKDYILGVEQALRTIGAEGLLGDLRLGNIFSIPEIPEEARQKGVTLLYDLNKKDMELSVEQPGESEEVRALRVGGKKIAKATVHGAIDLVNAIGYGDINSEAKDKIVKEGKQ